MDVKLARKRLEELSSARFETLNEIVVKNREAVLDFLLSLREIKHRSLYKEGGYSTWEQYLSDRVGWTRQHAARQLKGIDIQLEHGVMSGQAARALQHVEEGRRAEVVEIARARQGESITGSMVQDVHQEVLAAEREDAGSDSGSHTASPSWDAAVQSMRSAWEAVNRLAREPQARPLDSDYVLNALKNAANEIKQSKPYAVCYECKGRGCDTCRGTGMVGKMMWDRRPVEFVSDDDSKWVIA